MAISKEVTALKKEAEFIDSAAETHGRRIVDGVDELLGPRLAEGEDLPNLLLLIELLRRHLADSLERLITADQQHARELSEDVGAREARDSSFVSCRQGTISFKGSLSGLHGAKDLTALGLDGETPDSPRALVRVLAAANKRMDEGLVLPPPLSPDTPAWSAAQVAARLAALRGPLDAALSKLSTEEQETKGTLTIKWQALEAHKPARRAASSLLAILARIAGEKDLADRLNPEGGRPKGTSKPVEPAEPVEPTEPAEPVEPAEPAEPETPPAE